ncbi:MAG TPA: hypothetical protein VJK72_02400 [Candidatus Nanoarchaeia archaeon]|nr:hypothetical protein [Candidatus Nanoarchaeia archaeon]
MTETTQINVRLPEKLLSSATRYAENHGFSNVQELIKNTLRQKLFEEPLVTAEELSLIKKLAEVSEKRGLFKTENDLFRKLRRTDG